MQSAASMSEMTRSLDRPGGSRRTGLFVVGRSRHRFVAEKTRLVASAAGGSISSAHHARSSITTSIRETCACATASYAPTTGNSPRSVLHNETSRSSFVSCCRRTALPTRSPVGSSGTAWHWNGRPARASIATPGIRGLAPRCMTFSSTGCPPTRWSTRSGGNHFCRASCGPGAHSTSTFPLEDHA